MRIDFLNDKWVSDQAKAGKLALVTVKTPNLVILAASTEELRKLALEHAKTLFQRTLLSNVRNECLTVAFILTGTECEPLMCCCGASPACQQLLKLIRIASRREAGIAGADQRQRFILRQMR
jgi:hypothetical protein